MAARLRSILNEARSEVAPSAAHGLEGKVAALKSLDKLDAKVLSSLRFFVEDRRKDLEAREFVVKNLQSKLALLLRRVRSETERERRDPTTTFCGARTEAVSSFLLRSAEETYCKRRCLRD